MSRARAAIGAGLAAAALIAAGSALAGLDALDVQIGRALFDRAWVVAPASTKADDGLGPLFDARSCASCHPRDGRGSIRVEADGTLDGRGAVLALGRPDGAGDPVYGRRLQIDAVQGLTPEGVLAVEERALPDGRKARVAAPRQLAYGPLDPSTGLSLRAAPDLRGRGLLEQVPEAAVAAIAAVQPEAVRGRLRHVTLPDGTRALGRYGWKNSQPSLEAQSSEAFFLDMGLSTPLHPEPWGDCTAAQQVCRAAPHGIESEGAVEISQVLLARVVAYVASLPVPEPEGRADRKGERLFAVAGCAQCHQPALPTNAGGSARLFTDLLLHDLGPGLADTLSEPGVAAGEWRTAPLAGISDALRRKTGLLHDGRAASVPEALAWHGGQADAARRAFLALNPAERAALVAYVSNL
ncbi:MAG: di-heme oxidoredictase family protein [Pseudomonadota bacterium]